MREGDRRWVLGAGKVGIQICSLTDSVTVPLAAAGFSLGIPAKTKAGRASHSQVQKVHSLNLLKSSV